MKLHGDLISPFVRMAMVTAHEAGLSGKVALVKTSAKPQETNAALVALSPIGKIPILETDHGHKLYDSRVIMEYFCHVGGSTTLLPHEGVQRFHVLTGLALAQGMADAAVALRYETFARPEALRWPEMISRGQHRIIACLDEMEASVDSLSPVTLASIAAAVALGYLDFRHGALPWRNGRPKLSAFGEKFGERDSMKATALTA